MLYHILFPLREVISGLNVFRYITFRAGASAVCAFVICIVIGPWVIRKMLATQTVDEIRDDGPESHKAKAGTPTMGGLMILPAVILSTLLFARLDHWHIWLVVGVTLWLGIVGYIDDFLKKSTSVCGIYINIAGTQCIPQNPGAPKVCTMRRGISLVDQVLCYDFSKNNIFGKYLGSNNDSLV